MRRIDLGLPSYFYFLLNLLLGVIIAGFVFFVVTQVSGFHIGSLPAVHVDNIPKDINVTNFPDNQDVTVTNGINITNFPQNQEVTLTNNITCQFPELNLTLPGEINVANFPPLQQVNVTSLPPITGIISVSNFPDTQDVHITGPLTAFGSVMSESLSPIFQTDAVYGLNLQQTKSLAFGDALVSSSDSLFRIDSGSTNTSFGVLQSRRRLRYRSGQGSRLMFTARYTSSAAGSFQMAGLGHGEDGVFFGYYPTGQFGIMHSNRGKREVRNLTFTTGSSSVQNLAITLNNVVYNVPVTNAGGNAYKTAYEVYKYASYNGWETQIIGSSITFVFPASIPLIGSFSISGTGIVASFSLIQSGQSPTRTFIPQSQWNIDSMNGNGPSGVTLNTTLFNVFQISMQYLGAGAIRFFVETPHGEFVNVHTLRYPNSLSLTSFGNPSFPFTVGCYNTLPVASVNATIHVGSFAGFVEGKRSLTGNRYSIETALSSTVGSANYHAMFSLMNPLYSLGRTTQGILNIIAINAATFSTNPVTIYLFRSTTGMSHDLQGNPNFQKYSPSAHILVDKAATTFIPNNNDQLILTIQVSADGNAQLQFDSSNLEDLTLQPGDILTIAAQTRSGTATWVSTSIDLRQDY